MTNIYLILLCFLLFTESFANDNWDNFQKDWSAPLTVENARPILYTGTGLTALLVLYRDEIVEPFQEKVLETQPLSKDLSHFGDYMGQLIPNVIYMGGMYWNYRYSKNLNSLRRSQLMLKTTFYAGLTTTILKRIVNQRRPDKGDRLSFPSGHSTTAFAFASIIGLEHQWPWGVAAYSMATLVGLSRINDNVHYLHDVVFGATIGITYGVALHHLQQKNQDSAMSWNIFPIDDGVMANIATSF